MSDYTPVYKGRTFTSTASAAITGMQLLEVTGDNLVGPAAAGSAKVVGQAAHDTASGKPITVHGHGRPISEAVAANSVVAGQLLKAAATGQVTPWIGGDAVTLVVGLALAAGAAGSPVRYQGRRT